MSSLVLYILFGLGFWLVSQAFSFRKMPSMSSSRVLLYFSVSIACFVLISAFALVPIKAFIASIDGVKNIRAHLQSYNVWILVLGYFVVADFMTYWLHRLMHTRLLWSTHAFHHAPKVVNWVTGTFASPFQIFVVSIPALSYMFFPVPETSVAGGLVFIMSFVTQNFIHSNINLPFQKYIERVFVTPRVHCLHHYTKEGYCHSNFAFKFTIFDRIFGTYQSPEGASKEESIGQPGEAYSWRLLLGVPLKKSLYTNADVVKASASKSQQVDAEAA